MTPKRYAGVIEKTGTGYSAYSPDVPGLRGGRRHRRGNARQIPGCSRRPTSTRRVSWVSRFRSRVRRSTTSKSRRGPNLVPAVGPRGSPRRTPLGAVKKWGLYRAPTE